VTYQFSPARRTGLPLHVTAVLLLAGGGGSAIWLATQQQVGANFVLLILLALVVLAPLPLVAYRGYALLTARYSIERDGLRLRWGLRAEDIPLPEIEWVRPASDLAFDLPQPRLSWPGAVLGSLNVKDFGPVEYLASSKDVLLVATRQRVYAISPADPAGFVRAFQNATEMGSLTPIDSFSSRPVVFLHHVWDDRIVRWLVISGLLLAGLVFVMVSLLIPTRSTVSLGFTASGQPVEPVPAVQLLLLPILGAMTFVINLIGGVYFYRSEERRPVAYILFASTILTSILLLAAVVFIT
jgi:hypothetical protein